MTAIALDDSGARLLTGGHDYMLKMYDFGGMKSDAKPFRSLEVDEGHPVVAVRNGGRVVSMPCMPPALVGPAKAWLGGWHAW